MMELREDEVALTLLHTADWHLGARFPSFEEADRIKLTRARLDVIDRILSVAENNRVNAVLCAGDLFDEPTPERDWWQGLAKRLGKRKWKDRPVFLLPGNHDPLNDASPYHPNHPFRAELPSWVHVVDRDDFTYELGPQAVLYACPCRTQAGEMDLALRLPSRAPNDERIRVGMVHGQTFHIPGHQMNFPIAKDAVVQRGLDYLAIGDTHAFELVPPDVIAHPTVYPGTPEQLTFGEVNTGNVAVIFFPSRRRAPIVQPQRVAHWTWRVETIRDLESLRALRNQDLSSCVMRLVLEMRSTPAEYVEVEAILRELKGTDASHGRVGVMQIDRDALELDTRDIEQMFENLPPVVRAAARKLKEEEELGENAEAARLALYHLYRLSRGAA